MNIQLQNSYFFFVFFGQFRQNLNFKRFKKKRILINYFLYFCISIRITYEESCLQFGKRTSTLSFP